jgi:hypothetical protein
MSNENKSFTVKDRRLFTADGELRGETEEGVPSGSIPAPHPETPVGPLPPREPVPVRSPRQGTLVGLAEFLTSLGAQALDALMARPPQLDQARALIGVLEMLEEKTGSQRTAEESEVLETLLYQLRIGYVEQTRAGRA